MEDKIAFVFDTNFIIEEKNLNEVIDNLKDKYTVYVTQVSIDERIAQQCRELKKKYDEAKRNKEEYKDFATISFKKTYEEIAVKYKELIQAKYSHFFGEHIIPYKKDNKTFSEVIDRANNKLPPFSSERSASDKGFKDSILWLSLLSYFAKHGEKEVVLCTDDNAIQKYKDYLIDEFHSKTGKNIVINLNSYYKDILKTKSAEDETAFRDIPNLESLREQISSVIESVRIVESYSEYGDEYLDRTFTTSKLFDNSSLEIIFWGLKEVIRSHLFEQTVCASKVLEIDNRITNGDVEIPIENLEKAYYLYEEIKKNYPEYLNQFFEAVAKILNKNYIESFQSADDDDGLPF